MRGGRHGWYARHATADALAAHSGAARNQVAVIVNVDVVEPVALAALGNGNDAVILIDLPWTIRSCKAHR